MFSFLEKKSGKEKEPNQNKYSGYKILYFYYDCRWCNDQDDILAVTPIQFPVDKLNVNDDYELPSSYKVNNLPTLMLVDANSKEIYRWTGITEAKEINQYLKDNGYISDFTPSYSEESEVEVKNVVLADGSKYSGTARCSGMNVYPAGFGVRRFLDHQEIGRFNGGFIEGLGCLTHTYKEKIIAGTFVDNQKLEGWGLSYEYKKFSFGIHDGKRYDVSVNLNCLVKPIWDSILTLSSEQNLGLAKVLNNPYEVFVGIENPSTKKTQGFHFLRMEQWLQDAAFLMLDVNSVDNFFCSIKTSVSFAVRSKKGKSFTPSH